MSSTVMHAGEPAVLVDDARELVVRGAQRLQHGGQGQRVGDDHGRAGDVAHPHGVALLLGQREDVAQADHADDVVAHRRPGPGSGSGPRPCSSTSSATVASAATVATRGRGIIAARAVAVRELEHAVEQRGQVRRAGRRCSRDSSMIASRSRGVAACSTSWTGSMRSARSSRFEAASNSRISQPNSLR